METRLRPNKMYGVLIMKYFGCSGTTSPKPTVLTRVDGYVIDYADYVIIDVDYVIVAR